ncbi:MAG: hypothetical protein HY695_28030 [Deltaproteobacteria bacterium]|nr:hypothetical protein [Deltaproteobacteria bacterium]
MLERAIREYAGEKGFRQETLDRWVRLKEDEAQALLELAREFKLGENHFRDFMDWLEEIALRDGKSLREVLQAEPIASIRTDPRLGRNDKLKRVKEEVRRRRFPRLARIQDEIQKRIRELKLNPKLQISVSASLEGSDVTIQFKAVTLDELRRRIRELEEIVEKEATKEIFTLLRGEGDAGI